MKNEICKIDMFYDFIEFKNTMIKSYYWTDIKNNENIAVVSNDEQMFLNEKEFPNDQKNIIDQSSKFQHTKISAIALNAIDFDAVIFDATAPNAVDFDAVIFDANASNAIAPGAFNRTKSEKFFQSLSIKRVRDRFRKQSINQLKNQSNLSIFLLNKIDSSISSLCIPYAKSKKKKINDLFRVTAGLGFGQKSEPNPTLGSDSP